LPYLLGCLQPLKEAKMRVRRLEGFCVVILRLHQSLVSVLQFLHLVLECLLDGVHLVVKSQHLRGDFIKGQLIVFLDESLLLVGTEVEGVKSAGGAEVSAVGDELVELIEGASTLVVFTVGAGSGGEILDGGVSLNAVFLAEILGVVRSAVNITDGDKLVGSMSLHELVPSRLHALAVASPRRLELDEGRLRADGVSEVRDSQRGGVSDSSQSEKARDEESRLHFCEVL